MTDTQISMEPVLRYELDHPHVAAYAALHDPKADNLAAITWTATHLAAVALVLHPLARRMLPELSHRMQSAAVADHGLQEVLWVLDRRLTGDARVASTEVTELLNLVVLALDRHVRREHALVVELVPQLSVGQQQDLAGRLADAVRRAPTRPHPHTPVRGAAGALGFRIDAGADHLRDLLDSRSWPTPHDVPHPRESGRWGAYLTAAPYPPEDPASGS